MCWNIKNIPYEQIIENTGSDIEFSETDYVLIVCMFDADIIQYDDVPFITLDRSNLYFTKRQVIEYYNKINH